MAVVDWLIPWEFSPTLLLAFIIGAWLFWRGLRASHGSYAVSGLRQWLFWAGLLILYLSLHTKVDYYAERLFFAHRLQHVVLHHLGPLMVMLAYPGSVMRRGLPLALRICLRRFMVSTPGRWVHAALTHKYWVPLLFVLLVVVWLHPTVQFYSMLDWRLYRLMNWSVVISGFMYWNLILDRRPGPPAVMSPGARVFSPIITTVPQMLVGAIITFTEFDLYPVFDLCGRAIPGMTAVQDQVIGGLTMWVLAGFIEVFGLLYALGSVMRLSAKGRLQEKRRRPPSARQRAARRHA